MMNAGVVLIAAVVAADFLVAAGAEGFLTFTGQHDDADIVVIPGIRQRLIPASTLEGEANLLVMPNLDAANIAFNLMKVANGDGVTVGPMLLGAAMTVQILTPSSTVRRLVNMTAVSEVDALELRNKLKAQ